MTITFQKLRPAAVAACAATVLMLAAPGGALAAEAFDALKGGWAGAGRATFASGESEKLRCTARYSGNRANLALSLRCASSSAQINLSGHLDANGNRVSGDWSESSYGLSGGAHGTASGNSVRLKIGGGINGYLTLAVSGGRHTVAISAQGSTLTGVNVSLSRR